MDKPYYDVNDIMEKMNCSKTKAYEYIREIRSVSDMGKTAGRVMAQDFNAWAYGTKSIQKEEYTQKGAYDDLSDEQINKLIYSLGKSIVKYFEAENGRQSVVRWLHNK